MPSFWEGVRRSMGLEQNQLDAVKKKARKGIGDVETAAELDPFSRPGNVPVATRTGHAVQPDPDADNGVWVAPTPITEGEQVTIRYTGQLAQRGASRLFIHFGYGPGDWHNVQDLPMSREPNGAFQCELIVNHEGRLDFCFHDNAGNWDNNGGQDWSYEIHNGNLY